MVLRLPEGHGEHELTLRRVLERVLTKPEVLDLPRVEKVDQASAVHRVPRKAIGMPREDTFRLTPLNPPDRLLELRPTRIPRAPGLLERADHGNLGPGMKPLLQLVTLGFERESLGLFSFTRLAAVDKVVHSNNNSPRALRTRFLALPSPTWQYRDRNLRDH